MPVGDRTVDFNVPKDIPGNDSLGYPMWKEAFKDADYVWYVFRADLMAVGDPTTISIVSDHLDALKDWVDKARGKKPKIILIGTFADLSPVYSQNLAEFRQSVASGESIKIGLVKLKNAKLVVGSLIREKDAISLIKNLSSHL